MSNTETFTEKQMRLVLEQQCADLMRDHVKPNLPAGVGCFFFLADLGEKGNMAYVSSIRRQDAIKLVVEWLDSQDENADATSLRELLMVAGDLVRTLAETVGLENPDDPALAERLIERCRELRARAEKSQP